MKLSIFYTGLFPLILLAYFFGSLNSSIIFSKILKLEDPREYGSKNPGATNILRSGNKTLALSTLIFDMFKGFLPVFVAFFFIEDQIYIQIIGLCSILGHIFPIYYKFKGGKGVATSFGVILAFDIILGFICLLTWLITAFLFRYSALSAIVSFALLPIYTWFSYEKIIATSLFLILAIIVIYMHKTNIKNLLNNKETKIGSKN
ncbi:MAG: acyl-phosphate glycerol 3-phosphate acyltransferase [Gammaproteobacteria bacterium]|nr:acyl-phosphate glycerol 3-phosphate acyltransferase [Gammaproteobacteria bacterium]